MISTLAVGPPFPGHRRIRSRSCGAVRGVAKSGELRAGRRHEHAFDGGLRGRERAVDGAATLAFGKAHISALSCDCEDLCDVVEENLLSALRATPLPPAADYDVVLVSLAAQGTLSLARARKRALLGLDAPQEAAAWHFLTCNARRSPS